MGKRQIMVIDDDEMMRVVTCNILSEKYDVISAYSGENALKMIENEHPDMILSDLMMPGINGFEMLSIIREKYNKVIPVIFMTAYSSDDSEKMGFDHGAVDYIRKPVKADVLMRRVDIVMDNLDRIHELERTVEIEPMTGLYNKVATEKMITEVAAKNSGTFMMLDLDSFKLINDIYGHDKGDCILIRFAELLRNIMRSSDVIGRIGGDEFVAFCQNTREETVVAEKSAYLNLMLVEYAKSILGDDMNVPLGVSVGAVVCPDEGCDYKSLYAKADQALYVVKQNGKHGYELYKKKHCVCEKNLDELAQIRAILGERNNERGAYVVPLEKFQVIYQFLARFQRNYSWEIHFVVFTITSDDGSEDNIDSWCEEFIKVASKCLRVSDVLAKNTDNHVLATFPKTNNEECQVPIERVLDNWKKEYDSSHIIINFKEESLLNI